MKVNTVFIGQVPSTRGITVLPALALVCLLILAPASASDANSQPLQARYLAALEAMTLQLLSTQITDSGDPDYGALVSPSTNPQPNPRHSRAAEKTTFNVTAHAPMGSLLRKTP